MSLINFGGGLSAMGASIANQAGQMGLAEQKAEKERELAQLADQLATTREHTGRVEAGDIAATAAGKEHEFLTGMETQREGAAATLEDTRVASAEKIAGMQTNAKPAEVKEAEWYANASPQQKKAYAESRLAAAGVPLWVLGSNSGSSDSASKPASATPTASSPSSAKPADGTTAPTDKSAPAPAGDSKPVTGSTGFNEKALEHLPPAAAGTVKAMVEGREPMPSSMAMSKPYWQALIGAATQYDPTFDATTWSGRLGTRKDFTSGKSAQAVTALNTALGHAGIVSDSFDALDNFGGVATPLNAPKNWLTNKFGGSSVTNATQAVDALSSEARKVFAATGGGNLTELENWQKNFPINGSPDQQRDALKTFVGLLDSRLGALSDQYNRGMQRTDDPLNLLEPHARQVFMSLTGRKPENVIGYQTGKPPENDAPAIKVPQFSSPDDPGFKALPPGSQFMGPNGVVRFK